MTKTEAIKILINRFHNELIANDYGEVNYTDDKDLQLAKALRLLDKNGKIKKDNPI